MSNTISTIFITPETFPIHAIVKNAIPGSLRGFTWYVERNPENEKVLQGALGDDFNHVQYGYYLEHAKGFIPHLRGDHIAICVAITDITVDQLKVLSTKPTIFKIYENIQAVEDGNSRLTHPNLVKNGDGIDRVYVINNPDEETTEV